MMFDEKLEDGRLWKSNTDQLKHQEQNHLSELEGCLPSDSEVDYDPDIPLSLQEHSPTPIMASQFLLISIMPMDDSHMVPASGDSLPNRSATSSVPDQKYPLQ